MEKAPVIPNFPIVLRVVFSGSRSTPPSRVDNNTAIYTHCVLILHAILMKIDTFFLCGGAFAATFQSVDLTDSIVHMCA